MSSTNDRAKSKDNDLKLLSQLDDRLKRMKEKLLPYDPYILTCPTTYRMDTAQAQSWIAGTPFEKGEEHLQYLTYLPRDKGDNLLHTVGGWDDGKGGMKPTINEQKPGARSGTASPMGAQVPKKKISLLDYKKKSTGEAAAKAPLSRPTSPKPPKQNDGASAAEDSTKRIPEVKVSQEKELPPKSLKRPANEPIEPPRLTNGASIVPSHSPKRVRTSPSASKPPTKQTSPEIPPKPNKKPEASPPTSIDLPPLLSPTLPLVEKSAPVKLPPLLSPTLPPKIEEELARHEKDRLKLEAFGRSDRKGDAADKRQQHTNGKVQNRVVKEPGKTEYPNVRDTQITQTISKQKGAHTETTRNTSNTGLGQNHDRMPPKVRKTLIVKLKFSPHLQKRVNVILGVSPKSKRPTHGFRSEEGRASEAREKELELKNQDTRSLEHSRAPSLTNGTIGEKRRREEPGPDSSAAKRHKTTSSQDSLPRPRTPNPLTRSPVPSQNGSAQKSYLSTPVKDLKSAHMSRVKSSDSDAKTPLGSLRSSTPSITNPENGRPPSSTSSINSGGHPPSARSEERTALNDEYKKFAALGRTLKHEAKDLVSADKNPSAKDQKLSAALVVESILCFMLSFRLLDEANRSTSRNGDRSSWRSLLPLLSQTCRTTTQYPYIHGLACQIEAIVRDLIRDLDVEALCSNRLLVGAIEGSTATSTDDPSLPSSSSARRTNLSTLRDETLDNMRQIDRLWSLGLTHLSKESLRKDFPDTWEAQAKVPQSQPSSPGKSTGRPSSSASSSLAGGVVVGVGGGGGGAGSGAGGGGGSGGKNREKLIAKQYREEGYYLPMGPTSSILEVVRFGGRVLDEWTEKEGVEWVGRMGI